ncbi:hypothetical protein NDU88_005058 [Pleurodeles waltl]|uniref:Reverse transcriptase domain-containing protein n=1 Tax=Pleurodeles waltl TaxID=8319 RepID=A0AAV7M8W5_PLEWA|nr:hypothetical protein NDU88_005058 [Pleurodeles waltl]
MEPFAQRVRDRPEITGVTFGEEKYTIALYAENFVVTLNDPLMALLAFLEEVGAFGAVLGFQVNLSKSQALGLTLPRETVNELAERYPFQWQEDPVSYLGIQIARTVSETKSRNYQLLLRSVKADLAKWRQHPILWISRIATIKMSLLLRALFLFQALSAEPPPGTLHALQGEINCFIWGGVVRNSEWPASWRVNPSTGETWDFNVRQYYKAMQLRYLVEWSRPESGWMFMDRAVMRKSKSQSVVAKGYFISKEQQAAFFSGREPLATRIHALTDIEKAQRSWGRSN